MPTRKRRTILVRLGKFKAMDKYQRVSLIPNLLLDFKKLHDKKQADSGAAASNHGELAQVYPLPVQFYVIILRTPKEK
jgi:hypothetical protein